MTSERFAVIANEDNGDQTVLMDSDSFFEAMDAFFVALLDEPRPVFLSANSHSRARVIYGSEHNATINELRLSATSRRERGMI